MYKEVQRNGDTMKNVQKKILALALVCFSGSLVLAADGAQAPAGDAAAAEQKLQTALESLTKELETAPQAEEPTAPAVAVEKKNEAAQDAQPPIAPAPEAAGQ